MFSYLSLKHGDCFYEVMPSLGTRNIGPPPPKGKHPDKQHKPNFLEGLAENWTSLDPEKVLYSPYG
jgi:hypothetical protein